MAGRGRGRKPANAASRQKRAVAPEVEGPEVDTPPAPDESAAEPLPEQPPDPAPDPTPKPASKAVAKARAAGKAIPEPGEGPLDEPGTSIIAPATKAPEPHDPPLVDKPDRPGPSKRDAYEIGGKAVQPGYEATVNIHIANLSTAVPVSLPIRVVHGRDDGPTLFVSAAVHGDEIVGVEIIRRLLRRVTGHRINGTLLLVPVVNVFGFVTHDRYLPDRRDLNRSFPGSANGSLAAQLANAFRTEVVMRSDFGIDLHSAAVHRSNYPQIRVSADSEKAAEMALAFSPPAIITAPLREGSMREFARADGVEMLLYEAGEALRFDEFAIRIGVRGILRVMAQMGMIDRPPEAEEFQPVLSHKTSWLRSPKGGIFVAAPHAGALVEEGDVIGTVSNPFGDDAVELHAPFSGMIIGEAMLPVVNRGDALFHIAQLDHFGTAADRLKTITDAINADPLLDEDELI